MNTYLYNNNLHQLLDIKNFGSKILADQYTKYVGRENIGGFSTYTKRYQGKTSAKVFYWQSFLLYHSRYVLINILRMDKSYTNSNVKCYLLQEK